MKTIKTREIQKRNRRKTVAVAEATSVLKVLFAADRVARPKVFRVMFRESDGKIGRRDYATHWIHRYPAKMFHRIPRAILQSLPTSKPITLLDPFCGSGTVLLEGILLGHSTIGIDVNPMATLISKVKTTPIDPGDLRRHVAGILRRARASTTAPSKPSEPLKYWFKPQVLSSLTRLLASINQIEHPSCRSFFTICLSACVRPCSWADPTIAPPVKLAKRRLAFANEKYKKALRRAQAISAEDVYGVFQEVVRANLARLEELRSTKDLGSAEVLSGSLEACRTGLPDGSVDLVVTSPPYCGAQKYARSLRLEMLVLGLSEAEIAAVDLRTLGTERIRKADLQIKHRVDIRSLSSLIARVKKRNPVRAQMLSSYVTYLDKFASELHRVLKPTGHAFVTFGTDHLAGLEVDTAEIFSIIAKRKSLTHVATMVDTIPSRGMITVRHSTARTIPDERVVWLKRGAN